MKAVRLHEFGQCPVVEDVPQPAVSGPWDVLIEVGGASLCRTDLDFIRGQLPMKGSVALPRTLGHENAGWVRDVGSAVRNVQPGDAVIAHPLVTCGFCRPCRYGADGRCEHSAFTGVDIDGGMADLLLTNARSLVKLHSGLRPAKIAALADAGLTAYHAVRSVLPLLHPGTYAVVLGTGRLGRIGLQCLLALSPAEVMVVDMSAREREVAASLGAHHTVDTGGEHEEAIAELTSGEGAHVVLDFTEDPGNDAVGMTMLRRGGSYFIVGCGTKTTIPPIDLIAAEVDVVGKFSASHNDLTDLMALAAQRQVKLETSAYELDGVDRVIRHFIKGELGDWDVFTPNVR